MPELLPKYHIGQFLYVLTEVPERGAHAGMIIEVHDRKYVEDHWEYEVSAWANRRFWCSEVELRPLGERGETTPNPAAILDGLLDTSNEKEQL